MVHILVPDIPLDLMAGRFKLHTSNIPILVPLMVLLLAQGQWPFSLEASVPLHLKARCILHANIQKGSQCSLWGTGTLAQVSQCIVPTLLMAPMA